mmetsp:Transcript_13707/g.26534  ORF Transcript_13707/g.26534 Transcript_13707/m.26534 type:complete len:262 (+) Transcript_13707:110-895(+)|eukprot:CAMPEP_0171485726 /NCGR_PEP_ID=MMETSP0958-20121227/705_1 /TAXON_ID=87120 /ORGANISM="Aurantiochytrium limacinum, Strain ATCCMYA-1381" /LENGTH=261 /DNA_ID=CAMNT_0012018547 /DNA_START=36 /DNA_END=821 /DNA_ORIENTATION=+
MSTHRPNESAALYVSCAAIAIASGALALVVKLSQKQNQDCKKTKSASGVSPTLETRIAEWDEATKAARQAEYGEEKKKMINGEAYACWSEQLFWERELGHDGCALLNRLTLHEQRDLRNHVIQTLVGEFDPESLPFIESPFHCDYGYNLKLGSNVYFNHGCTILDSAPVTIGDGTMFGPGCQLATPNHPIKASERHNPPFPEFGGAINIGKHCWFGAGAIVVPGVTIGDECVIAAGSVVVRDIPSRSLVAGVPAKVIRSDI